MANPNRVEADDPGRMTVEEFRSWCERRDGKWELVNGQPRAMVRPTTTHGAILARTTSLLDRHLDDQGNDCRVVAEPAVIPRGFSRHNARAPDLGVTCSPQSEDDWDMKSPVVLVEVLSPKNAADTRDNILSYMTIPSVRDILILHSTAMRGEVISRGPDGPWPDPVILVGAGTPVTLPSIGFSAPLGAFYRTSKLAAEA